MARPAGQRSIDIPNYLWQALDEAAAFHNVPTNRLIADWLWGFARMHAGDERIQPCYGDISSALRTRLRMLPQPYDPAADSTRHYPRRVTPAGGSHAER